MDQDSDGAGLLLHWRILLGLCNSSALAFLLVSVVPWFSGWQGAVLALLGLFAGATSGDGSGTKEAKPVDAETSTVAVCGAAVLAGALWGAASSASPPSFLAGLVVVALLIWAWLRLVGADASPRQRDRIVLGCLAWFVAYLLGAGIAAIAL